MRDPHVQVMHYLVGSGEGISYRDPEPVSFSNHLGAFDLGDKTLRVSPAEHFSNEGDARSALDPFLRAWEIEADLRSNVGMIRFTFERVEFVDRDPPPPGSPHVIQLQGVAAMTFVGRPSIHLTCRTYPQPPKAFRATTEVQQAYRRWIGYRSGKEPLQGMAYFVLTLLESAAGDRPGAAHTFRISLRVLTTIRKLSSTKGDASTARKAGRNMQFQELSAAETQWLDEAVRRVIRRLGERASGAQLALITLSDLPKI